MTLRYGLGDSVSISTYIGSLGEVGVNTTTNTIHIFDGSTVGGTPLAKLSEVGGGGGGGSSPSYWVSSASGIYTTRNVAIGTNIVSSGSTVLFVKGDARITGILSIGTGTITLDPNSNTITIGAGITLDATQGSITVSGSKLADASGNANYSGIVTASSFVGNLTGTATTASTVQPNSVGLGTDTTGPYVQSVTGTANQITVTGGTGEGSTPTLSIPNQFTTPQDVTITRDLQVNRNLNVDGSITIGGTSATLFTSELKVYDPDLVLGFRTDTNGNDTSTDNTANHGGIAIASTEGTPLVNLFITGIETAPSTYKKIMWFKAGTFSGLGTDAWLFNYGVGIGSTQVPNNARLAVGRVIVGDDDITKVRNINASGITTIFTELDVGAGATIFTALPSGLVGVGTTNPTSKLHVIGDARFSGIVTASSFRGDGSNLTGIVTSIVAGTNITVSGSTGQVTINSTGGGTATASIDLLEVMLFS